MEGSFQSQALLEAWQCCEVGVGLGEHEPHAFHRTTTTEFYDSTDLVEAATERFVAGTMRKQLYDRLVKCEGLNYVEGGLPFNAALRNAGIDLFGAARFDWVHSALSTPHQPHTENNK